MQSLGGKSHYHYHRRCDAMQFGENGLKTCRLLDAMQGDAMRCVEINCVTMSRKYTIIYFLIGNIKFQYYYSGQNNVRMLGN